MDCLHFEACYYQPLQWCIEPGHRALRRRRAGRAQDGARPAATPTASSHWLAHPAFARAVDEFLLAERDGTAQYVDELNERLPFRHQPEAGDRQRSRLLEVTRQHEGHQVGFQLRAHRLVHRSGLQRAQRRVDPRQRTRRCDRDPGCVAAPAPSGRPARAPAAGSSAAPPWPKRPPGR